MRENNNVKLKTRLQLVQFSKLKYKDWCIGQSVMLKLRMWSVIVKLNMQNVQKRKMQCSSLKCKVHKNQNVVLKLNMWSQLEHDWGIPIGTQKGVLKLIKYIFSFTKPKT